VLLVNPPLGSELQLLTEASEQRHPVRRFLS
jgi:hypothetical protein